MAETTFSNQKPLFICPFKNYSNYTSDDLDSLLMYKHYINGWLTLFIIVIGILANSITICALLHRYMRRSSTNSYLLALSTSNLFSLICLLLMHGLRFTLVHPYRLTYCLHWYENWVAVSIPYLTPINQSFQLSGIYLIMAVSIDRYVMVKNHVKSSESNRRRHRLITWITILLIYFFSFLYTLPNWFVYTSRPVWSNLTEINGLNSFNRAPEVKHYVTEHTELGQNKLFIKLLNIYLYIPFVFAIPILILFMVNILIIYELIKIGDRKRQLGTAGKIDRNITIMLVSIVLVFLFCQVPLTLSHIFRTYAPERMFERVFFIYNSLTNFLTCIYMSANFALFCFFGQAFRFTIQYMFGYKKELPNQPIKRPSFLTAERRNSMFRSVLRRKSTASNTTDAYNSRIRNFRKSLLEMDNHNKILETEEHNCESELMREKVLNECIRIEKDSIGGQIN